MRKIFLSVCLVTISIASYAQGTKINSGPTENNLTSVYFSDVNTGYAVGDSGTILKTTNGGISWLSIPIGTSNRLSKVSFTNANTGYIVGEGETILRTVDAGATWDYIPCEMPLDLSSIYFADANTGFAMDEQASVLLKTFNGGTTWKAIKSNISNTTISSVYFTDQSTGFAVGGYNSMPAPSRSTGVIIKTADGGVTWNTKEFDATGWLSSVYFTDENTGYVVGGSGIILKTTDGGLNWITLSSGTTNWLSSVYFQDASTGYAVGGNILKTTDAGSTWTEIPGLTTNILSSVYFPKANEGYAVGDDGTIIKIIPEGEMTLINEVGTTESAFSIYPSPATSKITISSNKELSGIISISIINTSGKLLFNSQYQNKSMIDMDVSTLSKGVYLVKIQTNAGIETKKLLIQ